MKKRELESIISKIPRHPSPKVHLEQYSTPATLAATALWIAEEHYHDVAGNSILDLGSGTGRLGLGAALLGGFVVLVDVDYDAILVARDSALKLDVYGQVDLLVANVPLLPIRENFLFGAVIQNPPFGVHRRGSDVVFLREALKRSRKVYSIHKADSVGYIRKLIQEADSSLKVEVLLEEKICIPPEYSFHKKRKHCFRVCLIRVTSGPHSSS
jgi:predicted RNA methylase